MLSAWFQSWAFCRPVFTNCSRPRMSSVPRPGSTIVDPTYSRCPRRHRSWPTPRPYRWSPGLSLPRNDKIKLIRAVFGVTQFILLKRNGSEFSAIFVIRIAQYVADFGCAPGFGDNITNLPRSYPGRLIFRFQIGRDTGTSPNNNDRSFYPWSV